MKLAEHLTSYIAAAFTGLWITTSEADEAEREIVQQARSKKWKIAVWNVANGLRLTPSSPRRLRRDPSLPRPRSGVTM